MKAATSSTRLTGFALLSRNFKKPSKIAIKQGTSRLLLEDMVKRAERKLEEIKRMSHTRKLSAEEKAEELAEELYHKPGSLLTKNEIARLQSEIEDCEDPLESPDCDRTQVDRFRTITGECNNIENPTQGASTTGFRRLVPPIYEDGISAPLGRFQAQSLPEEGESSQAAKIGPFVAPKPSGRLISKTVVRNRTDSEDFSHILMQWGQFLDHDVDFGPELEVKCEGCKFTEMCEPIFVTEDDSVFGRGTPRGGDCLPFKRSVPVCYSDTKGSFSPREQINELTSYIDASQVYGSNREVGNAVRSFRGGRLRAGTDLPDGREGLPVDTDKLVGCLGTTDCFLCGDFRCNEQTSLLTMHTLWFREHNRIADRLQTINPDWSDERVYQEARKIVGAVMQKITYEDYLPKILGSNTERFLGSYQGYNSTVDASIPNAFATAAYRYGHSLIRPNFARLNSDYEPISEGPLKLRDAFFNPSELARSGVDNLLRGLVTAEARRVDESVNRVLTTQLFEREVGFGLDLAALNIQRSRDHGLPGYTIWRNFCGRVFDGVTSDVLNQVTFVSFLQLYGTLDNVELWIGGLAEERLDETTLLGATFACIFGLTFKNLRDGDRFYYENPGVFSEGQLRQIRQASLSRVICDNTGIQTIQTDAFSLDTNRVQCSSSSIPSIDLDEWSENDCYVRVGVPNRNTVVCIGEYGSEYCWTYTVNSQSEPRCISLACPTVETTYILAYTPYTYSYSGCTATPSSGLPDSCATAYYYPYNGLSLSAFSESNGFYRSLSSCQSGSNTFVDFSDGCAYYAQAQQDDGQDNPESPDSRVPVPDIPSQYQVNRAYSKNFGRKYTTSKMQAPSNAAIEKELRAELAKEMKKLN